MKQPLARFLMPLISLLSLLFIWEFAVYLFNIQEFLLPPPSKIVRLIWLERNILMPHLATTLIEAIVGLILAIILAIILGGLMSFSRLFYAFVHPQILISQMIPIIAIGPLLVLWFGFGIQSKIFIVILFAFFPILQSFIDGIKNINPDLVLYFKSLNASKWQIFTKLYAPFALINLVSGLKIAISYCMSAAMIGEWLGGQQGVGVYIQRSMGGFKIEGVFAGIFLIIISTLVLYQILNIIQKMLLSKYYHQTTFEN